MGFEVRETEIKLYQKLKLLGDIAPIKEHIKLFENKYNMKFAEFEKTIINNKESFEKWDDYIEWKAYQHKLDDLNKQYAGVEHERVRIT